MDYKKIKWKLVGNQGIEFSDKYELALNLYPKIKNYKNVENKQSSLPQQKTIQDTDISEDVTSLINKGKVLYNQGKYQEAIEWYDKALMVDPNFPLAQDNKKLALERLSKAKDNHKLDNQIQIGNQNNNNVLISELTKKNFEKSIQANKPLLVDFWAEWSGANKFMLPIFKKLTKKYSDKMNFGRLNIDAHQLIPVKYGVYAIPTFIIFYKGQLIERVVEAVGEKGLEIIIEKIHQL